MEISSQNISTANIEQQSKGRMPPTDASGRRFALSAKDLLQALGSESLPTKTLPADGSQTSKSQVQTQTSSMSLPLPKYASFKIQQNKNFLDDSFEESDESEGEKDI